jgi:glycerol uptake facilitator-like aquaporin
MNHITLSRRFTAEFIGTGLLVTAVVGSGIMGHNLSGGIVGLALLANTIATGAALVCLILAFAPISGAHFNPAVTLAAAAQGDLPMRDGAMYLGAQFAGGVAGVLSAHAMFAVPLLAVSSHSRSGFPQALSEFVATFGLLAVITSCSRTGRSGSAPFAVGAYITAAYWFTASTSFANPAVTVARAFTDTFAGIRPADVAPFLLAQAAGAVAGTMLMRWLVAESPSSDHRVVAAASVSDSGGASRRETTSS